MITGCPNYVINTPGLYRLAANCSVPAGNGNYGIAINSVVSGVDLDLNGYTISGPGQSGCSANSTIGIYAASANANIHNGTLTGHQVGLEFYGNRSSINNRDNKANHITATGNCEGIRLFDADYNDISGNNLSGNIANGMLFIRAHYNTFTSNTVNNGGGSGGGGAVAVMDSNRNVIASNSISNSNHFGMRLLNSDNNVIASNTINSHDTGLLLDDDAEGNIIKGNTALASQLDLNDAHAMCVNTWTENTFLTSSGPAGCIH
jgi:parallel beta-helix repeat protein